MVQPENLNDLNPIVLKQNWSAANSQKCQCDAGTAGAIWLIIRNFLDWSYTSMVSCINQN